MKIGNWLRFPRPNFNIVKSAWFWIIVWVVLVVIATSVISFLFWNDLKTNDVSSAIRNIVLAAAAVIALPLAIWRSIVAERQADTAQQSLLNERYQKSAEMLGHIDKQSVRLGGIYALDRLAAEYPNDYHIQVMKLFSAFVVDQTGEKCEQEAELGLTQDVQEVMRVIAGRDKEKTAFERQEGLTLNFSHCSLVGFAFSKANFANIDFTKANLSRVKLWQGQFSGSVLRGANLTKVDLTGADLQHTDMRRVNLSGANLIGANLRNANLGLVDLASERLWGSQIFPTNLSGARLMAADLTKADLGGADLSKADLGGANLTGADLGGANLSGASLKAAILSRANLSGANLTGANLGGRGADLSGAKLEGANFSDANLDRVNFSDADFSSGTSFKTETILTQDQIDQAQSDPTRPPCLNGLRDAVSGNPLEWRGQPLDDDRYSFRNCW